MRASALVTVALIALGGVLVIVGLAVFGYSHEASVLLALVGFVVVCAGGIRVAHSLPPDSSPW